MTSALNPVTPIWNLDEIRVLVAVHFAQGLGPGDDPRGIVLELADAFGRTPSSVDRQLRNIPIIMDAGHRPNIGKQMHKAVVDYLADPQASRTLALEVCGRNGWYLRDLVAGRVNLPASSEPRSTTNNEIQAGLQRLLDRLSHKIFSTGSQGFFGQSKINTSDGRRYQAQVSAVLIGSKNDPRISIQASAEAIAYEIQTLLDSLHPKSFRSGRTGLYANSKVRVGEERYQVAVQAVEIGGK